MRFARATNWKLSFEIMAVPRVVPQHSDFNNLQCQTSLTALTGAKGILPRCQTVTTRKLNRAYARPPNGSAIFPESSQNPIRASRSARPADSGHSPRTQQFNITDAPFLSYHPIKSHVATAMRQTYEMDNFGGGDHGAGSFPGRHDVCARSRYQCSRLERN